jgi:hypothetical protein
MSFKRIRALAAGLALFAASPAIAQTGVQFQPGTLWGNSTAAQRPGKVETVTAILDRALGSVRGSIIERGASAWGLVGPSATAGLAWVSQGTGADPVYGIVGLAGGGCAAALTASNGGILYSTATTCAILAGTATARLPLLSGANTTPLWGAFTLPASVTSGGVACFTSTTVMGSSGLLTASALLLGGGAGVCPSPMGSLGTTTTVLHGNAAGAPSFGSVVSADMNITATNCTNQFVSAISSGGVGTCSTVTLASAQFANQGTTTTLLHGNAAGNPAFGQVVFADIAAAAFANGAQVIAGTANLIVTGGFIYNAETTTTFGATTTFDFSTFISTNVTLTGNITTQTLTNVIAGKAGTIQFTQDGTGSRTTVWNTIFKFAGGTTPTLSTTPGAVDLLSYSCLNSTFCQAALAKDVK